MDVTIQEYGSPLYLLVLLFDNVLDTTTKLNTGQSLMLRDVLPEAIATDTELTNFYRRNNLRVNTHQELPKGYWDTIEDGAFEGQDGDYWQLQNK